MMFCIIGQSCHKYHFCHDKYVFVATKHVFCRNKSMLAATKRLSRQNYVCRDKIYLSQQAKDVFSRNKHVFVVTKVIKIMFGATKLLSWQACFCHVETKIILVTALVNDSFFRPCERNMLHVNVTPTQAGLDKSHSKTTTKTTTTTWYNRNDWLGVKQRFIYGNRIWHISLIKTGTQSLLLVTFNSAASRNKKNHTPSHRSVGVFSPKPNLSALFVRIWSFQHRLTVKKSKLLTTHCYGDQRYQEHGEVMMSGLFALTWVVLAFSSMTAGLIQVPSTQQTPCGDEHVMKELLEIQDTLSNMQRSLQKQWVFTQCNVKEYLSGVT